MRKILWVVLAGSATLAGAAHAQVYHEGYYRQNGTYVAPHYQTAPDSSKFNNYSTQGNTNPYTGQPGTVDPYKTPAPVYTPQPQYGSSYGR